MNQSNLTVIGFVVAAIIIPWINHQLKHMNKEEGNQFFKNILFKLIVILLFGYQTYNFFSELINNPIPTRLGLFYGVLFAITVSHFSTARLFDLIVDVLKPIAVQSDNHSKACLIFCDQIEKLAKMHQEAGKDQTKIVQICQDLCKEVDLTQQKLKNELSTTKKKRA